MCRFQTLVRPSVYSQVPVLLLNGKRLSKLICGEFEITNPPLPAKVARGTRLRGLFAGLIIPSATPVLSRWNFARSAGFTVPVFSFQSAYPAVNSFTKVGLATNVRSSAAFLAG